ncbi:amidohydrolase, partial [Streptomyces sp. YS-3]
PPVTASPGGGVRWRLALDEIEPTGAELRPRLPLLSASGEAHPTGPGIGALTAAPAELEPVELDALTASGDPTFLATLAGEGNLPADYAGALSRLLT